MILSVIAWTPCFPGFVSEFAMNNAQQIATPRQYLSEICGGEIAAEETFDDQRPFQAFLSLASGIGRVPYHPSM